MISSHHNFCQVQSGSDQIGSGDGKETLIAYESGSCSFLLNINIVFKRFSVTTANCPAWLLLFPSGSRFSTPRSMLKLSKKRALSISPLSDASVDLQTVIRTSPNSLVAFVNSRCNPNGASSYGHLSVSAMRSDISLFYAEQKSTFESQQQYPYLLHQTSKINLLHIPCF